MLKSDLNSAWSGAGILAGRNGRKTSESIAMLRSSERSGGWRAGPWSAGTESIAMLRSSERSAAGRSADLGSESIAMLRSSELSEG